MKSMEISSHFHTGTGKGCKYPGVRMWSALTLPQVSHYAAYWVMSYFMLDHQYKWRKSWYILLLPGWIDSFEWWASFKIFLFSSSFDGTTNLSLYLTTSCSSILKWGPCPSAINFLMWGTSKVSCLCSRIICSSNSEVKAMWANTSAWLRDKGVSSIWCDFQLKASATTLAFPGW